MTVDPNVNIRRSAGAVAEAPSALPAGNRPALESPVLGGVLRGTGREDARFAAIAPLGLDVMGGLAEYAGALLLSAPLGDHVCAAASRREDGLLSVAAPSRVSLRPFEAAMTDIVRDGTAVHAAQAAHFFRDERCIVARCVVGALVEGVRAGLLPGFPGGLAVSVATAPREQVEQCIAHALCAATLTAAGGALECAIDPVEAAAVAQRVANDWLGLAPGMADAMFSLVSEPGVINQLQTDGYRPGGSVPIPSGVELVGIHSGVDRPDGKAKYDYVRTAAFMGRALIERIIQHEAHPHDPWDGFLSRVSVNDYVEKFRDRLPTKLTGAEFLERFGETGDELTRIDPAVVYKIRSRTEHHIYEHARARDFVECMWRAGRSRDEKALRDAGELMCASHWSYGQRCGLASVETDLLVNLIRQHGEPLGVYGARTTGRGCGGIVAVLMKTGDRTFAALNAALDEYARQTGRIPRILRGSLPGSLLTGPQPL